MTETDEDVALEQEDGIEVDLPEDKDERSGKVVKKEEVSLNDQNEESEELAGAESDEERETIRARRREERKHRKIVGKERAQAKDRLVASLQMQVQDLSERLSQVDRKQSGTDFAKLEEELQQAISTANEAQEHLKNSAEASDWEGLAKANELYYTARRRAEYLAGIKQKVTRQGAQQQAPQLDQRVVENASKWMKSNGWYNHSGDDVDSVVTKAVDNQLAKEGYDPRTEDYWAELNDRLKEKIPHRFAKAKRSEGGAPPVSGSDKNSSSGGSGSGGGKFFLSAERAKAIREMGIWDDAEKRNNMIKRYRDYDREHAGDKK